MNVQFGQYNCTMQFRTYPCGQPAIALWDEDGPVATASVAVPDYPLKEGHILIKDYDSNLGVLAALVEAGVVRDTGETVDVGFAQANVCELLIKE